MATRKLVTISLPPQLLDEAQQCAEKENRTQSEFFREALRFYLETAKYRKESGRERIFNVIHGIQKNTRSASPRRIRTLIREAIHSVRRTG